jgi:hypothetical protein
VYRKGEVMIADVFLLENQKRRKLYGLTLVSEEPNMIVCSGLIWHWAGIIGGFLQTR